MPSGVEGQVGTCQLAGGDIACKVETFDFDIV